MKKKKKRGRRRDEDAEEEEEGSRTEKIRVVYYMKCVLHAYLHQCIYTITNTYNHYN